MFFRTKKISTTGPVPKHCLGFNYICSEYYELYLNFDETQIKRKEQNFPNKKDKILF